MIRSRLTRKARTTIPRAVRDALRLRPGDTLAYAIDLDRVILTRADVTLDGPFACFEEWAGAADTRGYAGF